MFCFALNFDISECRASLRPEFLQLLLLGVLLPDSCFLTPGSAFPPAAFKWAGSCVFPGIGPQVALTLALKLILSLQVTHSTGYRTLLPTQSNTNSVH